MSVTPLIYNAQSLVSAALHSVSHVWVDPTVYVIKNTLCARYVKQKTTLQQPGPESVLKVLEFIENGKAKQFLMHDWEQPSATWVGRAFDWLCSAGEFSHSNQAQPLSEKVKRAFESTQAVDAANANCEKLSAEEVLCVSMATGEKVNFNVRNKTMHCPYVDPEFYKVHISLNSHDFEQTVSKVRSCLAEKFLTCNTNCLGCWHMPEKYLNRTIGSRISHLNYTSPHYDGSWNITIEAQDDISEWFNYIIQARTEEHIKSCESESINNMWANVATISIVAVPILFGFVIAGGVCCLKSYDRTHPDKTRKIAYHFSLSEDPSDAPMMEFNDDEENFEDYKEAYLSETDAHPLSFDSLRRDKHPAQNIKQASADKQEITLLEDPSDSESEELVIIA